MYVITPSYQGFGSLKRHSGVLEEVDMWSFMYVPPKVHWALTSSVPDPAQADDIMPKNYSGSSDIWQRDLFIRKIEKVEEDQLKIAGDLLQWVKEALVESEKMEEQIALAEAGVEAQRIQQNASINSLKIQFDKLNK